MSKHRNRKSAQKSPLKFPVVDVVIPYYGPSDLMKICLESLPAAAGNIPIRVIVVDDFFQDGEDIQGLIGAIPYHIDYFRNKENKGFGATCNRGASCGGSAFILFLNADVQLLPGSLETMVDFLKQSPDVSVVGPKLLFREDSPDEHRPAGKVQHAGIEINIRGEPFHIFCGWSRDNPKVDQPRTVPAVTGAMFLVRREDFIRLGGFDPIWGRGTFEDVDLCFKLASQGKKTVYLPSAEGYHFVGGSQTPYPIGPNMMIFKARWGAYLQWTEWPLW